MDPEVRMFRKAAFGGFHKEDVLNYIQRMKRDFYDYKAQVEETVRDLQEKLAAMQSSDAAEQNKALTHGYPALDISDATAHFKQVADEICENLTRLLNKLQDQTEAEAEEAEKEDEAAHTDLPEEAGQSEAQESNDPVDSILRGLFLAMPEEEKKQPVPAVQKDADLIAAVLPKYLQ